MSRCRRRPLCRFTGEAAKRTPPVPSAPRAALRAMALSRPVPFVNRATGVQAGWALPRSQRVMIRPS
eukprot:1595064-Pyramimonas_sp.AAC.1